MTRIKASAFKVSLACRQPVSHHAPRSKAALVIRQLAQEYVKYTNRHALVQEFVPTPEEQRLYDVVSEYLQQPTLYALPAGQRSLMTLILRKLLASSTYAISDTLSGLAYKLETATAQAEKVDAPPEQLAEDWEAIDELADEWEPDGGANGERERPQYTPEQVAEMRREMAKLREFHALARSIAKNSKGEVLLTALRRGFAAAAEAKQGHAGATLQQKALVFTESRRTQEYLFRILEQTEFCSKVMLFNGTNTDPTSKEIYRTWLKKHAGTDRVSGSPAADMRAALVDCFRDEAAIMIATKAAAEGLNLLEKRIATIYQKCRTPQQIQFELELDQLQRELDTEIVAGQRDAREKLLDNFDQEVVEKVRIQSAGLLDRFNERLWLLTRYPLAAYARFDDGQYSFYLTSNPFPGETIYPGPYRLGKNVEEANIYRVGHPLAQRVLAQAMGLNPSPAEVVFDYSGGGKNIAVLTPLVGKSGWLTCSRLAIQSLESEDALILAGVTDTQEPLDETACRRLFNLNQTRRGMASLRHRQPGH